MNKPFLKGKNEYNTKNIVNQFQKMQTKHCIPFTPTSNDTAVRSAAVLHRLT